MKSLLMLVALCLSLSAQALRIGIVGDQTGSDDLPAAYRTLEKGLAILKQQKVAAVIHVGDLIESSRSPTEIEKDYTTASTILNSSGIPWWLTPGDHDVNPPTFVQNSSDRSRELLFRRLYSKPISEQFAQSFDLQGYHFVLLNSMEHLHTDPRWGNIYLSQISDAQFEWLKTDLARNRKSRATIVVTHQPLWYNHVGWQRIHELLRANKVIAVVGGHFHYNQDEGTRDGIRYVIVGPTGATTYLRDASSGATHHVTVLEIKGRSLSVQPIGIDQPLLRLHSRGEMERVQAISIMLGEQYAFAKANKPCWKDGALQNPDIILEKLGNPTDRPASIEISEPKSPWVWKEKGFTSELCRQKNAVCPGARTWISNDSSVEMAPGPVWRGSLESAQPTDLLEFSLSVTIPGDQGQPIRLQRPMKLSVPACPN